MTEQKPLRLGIAGLGTVGVGVLEILTDKAGLLTDRSGRAVEMVAVSARDKTRDRGVDLAPYDWCDDPVDLARHDRVDAIIELIGGSEGAALDLAREGLAAGKHFITANKALIAFHGLELAKLAEQNGVDLRFEAAVAGGIPILKALREGLSANAASKIFGILNGTCNFILSKMEAEGRAFDDVLDEAQRLGYAEADPSFDIDGFDTMHKAVILAMLGLGVLPDPRAVKTEGIRSIDTVDIDYARDLGYRIKLLGVAKHSAHGYEFGVYPAMVPHSHALANVMDATNAVLVTGDAVGETVYVGPGAGRLPTASSVVADIVDTLRGLDAAPFGVPADFLKTVEESDPAARLGHYYIRLRVQDEVGVMADVVNLLSQEGVSIDGLLQRGQSQRGGVYVVIVTHESSEACIARVLTGLTKLDPVLESPTMIRIES